MPNLGADKSLMKTNKALENIYKYALTKMPPTKAAREIGETMTFLFHQMEDTGGFTEEKFEALLEDHVEFIERCKLKDQKESA